MALCLGLPIRWVGTRKVKPIWILLKQETVSGSGISWAICKSASRSRQITMPVPHHSFFCKPDALPAAQPTASKHWRQTSVYCIIVNVSRQYRLHFVLPHCHFMRQQSLIKAVSLRGHWVEALNCAVNHLVRHVQRTLVSGVFQEWYSSIC